MSYYLKYRPQKTSQLDIKQVRDFFQGIVKSGSYAHAYLFSGPRGTGKTSSARILAKLLNCEHNLEAIKANKPLSEPCGTCPMCQRVTRGSSLSVVEMDGASNRGIDDIRSLRERIALAPAEGAFVIYIIDEVHMLTTEAFNALLKTLEEPPPHAVFVLCTTEFSKLPATIVSRCTQVIFPKATPHEVIVSLEKAIKGEKLTISDKALTMLSEAVDGSFRDGMKLLERLAQSGPKIEDEAVAILVQRTSQYDPNLFIDHLLNKDVNKALAIIDQGEKDGLDFAAFGKRMLAELRARLLASVSGKPEKTEELRQLTQLACKHVMDMKLAYIIQLPLELLAVEWSFYNGSEYLVSGSQQKTATEAAGPMQKSPSKSETMARTSSKMSETDEKSEKAETEARSAAKPGSEARVSLEEMKQRWTEMLAQVKPLNHSLEALLRSSRPYEAEGSRVTIEVFYKFHKDRLEQNKYREAIEDVLSSMFGGRVGLEFILGSGKGQKSALVSKSDPAGDELVKAAEEIFS